MNYLKILKDSYEMYLTENPGGTKQAFIAEEIFDITTYDDDISDRLGGKMLEVCAAISNRTTFEYIKHNRLWYTTICNLPFVAYRIEWGTSIRGAWWHCDQPELNRCGLYDEQGEQILSINFSTEDWDKFVAALMEFANDNIK